MNRWNFFSWENEFWDRVQHPEDFDPEPCWLWEGCTPSTKKAPQFHVEGVSVPVPYLAYLTVMGMIPPSRRVVPVCGRRACCNPSHLSLAMPDSTGLPKPHERPEVLEGIHAHIDKEPHGGHWNWLGKMIAGRPTTEVGDEKFNVRRVLLFAAGHHLSRHKVVVPVCGKSGCVNPEHMESGFKNELSGLARKSNRAAIQASGVPPGISMRSWLNFTSSLPPLPDDFTKFGDECFLYRRRVPAHGSVVVTTDEGTSVSARKPWWQYISGAEPPERITATCSDARCFNPRHLARKGGAVLAELLQ